MKLKDIQWKGQHVGVTGSDAGLTSQQRAAFTKVVRSWARLGLPATFHDGDCIGVDDWAHQTVFQTWTPSIPLVGHPPNKPNKRAFNPFDFERPKKSYLKRDDELAREVDILIAMPREYEEIQFSGTWATVRYARKHHKIVVIIRPDGVIKVEDNRDKAGPLFDE